jgi:hypothetical protein
MPNKTKPIGSSDSMRRIRILNQKNRKLNKRKSENNRKSQEKTEQHPLLL